jgi:lysozyme family protein
MTSSTKSNGLGRFRRCVAIVLRHEGGYVNHPRDPGGPTNWGITQRTLSDHLGRQATVEDVQNLDRQTAEAIYRRQYWNVVRGDDLSPGIDLVVFDAAVNSGPRRAARWLQQALRDVGLTVEETGQIDNSTVEAVRAAHRNGRSPDVIRRACQARLAFLQRLNNFDVFGRGWTRRVAEIEAQALRWAVEDQGGDPAETLQRAAEQSARTAEVARRGVQAAALATPAIAAGLSATVNPGPLLIGAVVVLGIAAAVYCVARLIQSRERRRAYTRAAQETRN